MNEIKVGMWVRYRFNSRVELGKVFLDSRLIIQVENKILNKENVKKTADNLVDLLEVGDIVEVEWNDDYQSKDEYILTKSLLKNLKSIYQYKKDYKITAIELHENRQKQVIEE